MKTLYININNEQIQSNEELKVLEHDLDGDFFFYFGGKIAKGCNIDNEYAVITDFNTEDYKEEYKQITTQWNEIKTILFSEECKGRFELTLPNGYIHWLKFHPQYVSAYHGNFSHGEPAVITIDLEELYEDSVEDLQRKILRKLQRDDLYQEIDEMVFNDDAVTFPDCPQEAILLPRCLQEVQTERHQLHSRLFRPYLYNRTSAWHTDPS